MFVTGIVNVLAKQVFAIRKCSFCTKKKLQNNRHIAKAKYVRYSEIKDIYYVCDGGCKRVR